MTLFSADPQFFSVAEAVSRMSEATGQAIDAQAVEAMCESGEFEDVYRAPLVDPNMKQGEWRILRTNIDAWIAEHQAARPMPKPWWNRVREHPVVAGLIATAATVGIVVAFVANVGGTVEALQTIGLLDPTPASTVTPVPTAIPTPLLITPATNDETLILIADFYNTAAVDSEPHIKIWRQLQQTIEERGEFSIRVALEPTELTADQRADAVALGKRYNASMIIWGEDTGVEVYVNFSQPAPALFYCCRGQGQRKMIARR